DLSADAKVHGMVHFLFACYGGGCPENDTFRRMQNRSTPIAPKPLMARLPQALLSHPQGGALGVLAHVDRAWAYSFRIGQTGQTQGFRDVIGRMMKGERLGQATDPFNFRWSVLSADLTEILNKMRGRMERDPSWRLSPVDAKKLANQWVARDDARNYV